MDTTNNVTFIPMPGQHITIVAEKMAGIATAFNVKVSAEFSGVDLTATPGMTSASIVTGFYRMIHREEKAERENISASDAVMLERERCLKALERLRDGAKERMECTVDAEFSRQTRRFVAFKEAIDAILNTDGE